MKVLFICRANVGRSQMAEAIFNNLTKDHIAISAGLNPPEKWEGEKLSKTRYVSPSMDEIGIDVTEQISKRISDAMVLEADKIVVIGEKEGWPDFLKNSEKVIYWDIVDPSGGEMELHRTVRSQIEKAVKNLIQEIDSQ